MSTEQGRCEKGCNGIEIGPGVFSACSCHTAPPRCAKGCNGMEIGPGLFSGCSCFEGKLANGAPEPEGFLCDCPNHPMTATEAVARTEKAIGEMADELSALSDADRMAVYLGGLYEAAETRILSRKESFLILQGTLADMLAAAIPGMAVQAKECAAGPARTNALAFVEIAKNMRSEMLGLVHHAMAERSALVMPGLILGIGRTR